MATTDGIQGLINLTYNLDCYDLLSDIEDDADLGYYWIEESGCYGTEALDNLARNIDYENFGGDIALEEGGTFTDQGYLTENGNDFVEEFDGAHVPEEYKVFPRKEQNRRKGKLRQEENRYVALRVRRPARIMAGSFISARQKYASYRA